MNWHPVIVYLAAAVQFVLGVVHILVSDRPALAQIRSWGADDYWQRRLKTTLVAGSITRSGAGLLILAGGYLLFERQVGLGRVIVLLALVAPASSAVLIPLWTPTDARKAAAHGAVVLLALVGVLAARAAG